jgi:hypothetical protein
MMRRLIYQAKEMEMNRRATVTTVIRDNSIYSIGVRTNGYFRTHIAMHYRRRFQDGRVVTGPAYK